MSTSSLKKTTALVVGRFGCGKSTFLNALAGVHWKIGADGNFSNTSGEGGNETFPTGMGVRGCTQLAVAHDIQTFNGGKLTVIDTVGYDDTVNADSFYTSSNLTEVMDLYIEISAVVIVINSKDPRMTHGFVESLACVPKSFKKEIKKNVVLVFANWTAEDEGYSCDKPNRGFSEQIKIIRGALQIEEDVEIPSFWMDNRPFKECNENAKHSISELTKFLSHLAIMPGLSCQEFKEMRALSQSDRAVRNAIKKYFEPSKRELDKQSGFEKFLFECANTHKDLIPIKNFTSKAWAEKLSSLLAEDIKEKLPKNLEKLIRQVADQFEYASVNISALRFHHSPGDFAAKGIFYVGLSACVLSAVPTFGIGLLALPVVLGISLLHARMLKKTEVIEKVVFAFSANYGDVLRVKITDLFTTHVDNEAVKLQELFKNL